MPVVKDLFTFPFRVMIELYSVFGEWNVTGTLVRLNLLITFFIKGLGYSNVTQIYCGCAVR